MIMHCLAYSKYIQYLNCYLSFVSLPKLDKGGSSASLHLMLEI